MDKYITGSLIKELRTKNNMTQSDLADKLNVSDKTISKWETGKGYPDITLLEPLATALGVSAAELLSGIQITNSNVSSNMLRAKFYVCPLCGNVIYSTGELALSCHGISLTAQTPEPCDDCHPISIEETEDEYFIEIDHDMSKTHYISFVAAVTYEGINIIKLYPEGPSYCRVPRRAVQRIIFYCNKDGLFFYDIPKKPRVKS